MDCMVGGGPWMQNVIFLVLQSYINIAKKPEFENDKANRYGKHKKHDKKHILKTMEHKKK